MDNQSIQQQVRTFICTNFYIAEASQLPDDASLLDEGIIDSTGVIEIIHFLETSFGISIEDPEIVPHNLDSIGRIAAFVARKQGVVELPTLSAVADPVPRLA